MDLVKAWVSGSGVPDAVNKAARDERIVLAVFTATIFLSALLLFSVQPMFAKMVLPKLGGSPSVWAVSMCFFQGALLLGYCYAHALNRYLGASRALMVHLVLLAGACIALPIGLPAAASEPPEGGAYLWLVGILTAGVGLPFFAVSANAPLLQSWFSRTGHPHAADPYFLYGASNFGSLLALLAYPLVLEPVFGLGMQSSLWAVGFVLLGVTIAGCGWLMLVNAGEAKPETAAAVPALAPAVALRWRQRALWVGLSFVPSALLVAFTTFVTTDIASAPFLWVIPLALFLVTFIMVFKETPVIPQEFLATRLPLVASIVMVGLAAGGTMQWLFGCIGGLLAFFMTCLIAHRELYNRRPAGAHLTEFYLWMSLGGVLGGIFSALLAPRIFSTTLEFPLLVLLGLICRPEILAGGMTKFDWRRGGMIVAVTLGLMLVVELSTRSGLIPATYNLNLHTLVIGLLAGVIFLARGNARIEVAAVTAMFLGLAVFAMGTSRGHSLRSFFGVHRIMETPDGEFRLLVHGTTVHGAQRLRDQDGKPVTSALPATYYSPKLPMARGFELARAAQLAGAKPLVTGIVGLGAGSLACMAKPGESLRYYEIDPTVSQIARDPKSFDFLSRCKPDTGIVIGDARLTLAKEPAGTFDYLVIDAFASDAIPVHLLTVEAFKLYLGLLSERGVLALHITNRHLELAPVVAANAAQIPGLNAVVVGDWAGTASFDATNSMVVLLARHEDVLRPALGWRGAERLTADGTKPWTDDFSNILSSMVRGWRR